jgi:hypothetical protein
VWVACCWCRGSAPCPIRLPTYLALSAVVRCESSLMHPLEQEGPGWAEIRAVQDDDQLGTVVRLLQTAYGRGDRARVRAQAARLLMDLPGDLVAAQVLLRRLRDVGE